MKTRPVCVIARDDALHRALSEQRSPGSDWQVAPFGRPQDEPMARVAIVVLDLDDADARSRTVDALRAEGFSGPILVMVDDTAASRTDVEPVVRPVRLGALLARIEAHCRAPADEGMMMLGPYILSASEYLLRDGASGRLIRLTELELRLLSFLAEAEGELVDRDRLLEQVWGYSAGVDTHTVETHIWRLRQKVETDDPATRFLVTEAGGYRLALAGAGPSE